MNIAANVCKSLRGDMAGKDACLVPGPGHSKGDRSLSVKNDSSNADGFVVFSHAGDDAADCRDYVREHAGLPAWKPSASATRKESAEYVYTDEDGEPYLRVTKVQAASGKKSFYQHYWDGEDWRKGGVREPLPYNLPEVMSAGEIFIVEGEKDADRLISMGLVATCNAMGAGKWDSSLARYFEDAKVFILADNDEAGRRHADAVEDSLSPVARRVKQVHFPVPEKGDVSDWLDGGKSKDDLYSYVDAYDGSVVAGPQWASLQQCDGTAELPPRKELVKGMIPRSGVGFIGGQSGAGKTFLSLDLVTCVATGEDFAGRRVMRRGGVIYVPFEGAGTIQERVKARRIVMGARAVDMPLYIPEGAAGQLQTDEAYAAMEADLLAADANMRALHGVPLVALVLDTVTAAGMIPPDKENDPGAWAKVFLKLSGIASRLDIAICLVHHAGKDATTGLRGSSAARAGADFVIMMSADRDEISGEVTNRFLHQAKSRTGEEGPIAAINVVPVVIGHDEDGEEQHTLVLEFDASAKYAPAGQRTFNAQGLERANNERRETENSKWKAEIIASIEHLTDRGQSGVGKAILREAVCTGMNPTGKRTKQAMSRGYERALKELIETDSAVVLTQNGQLMLSDNDSDKRQNLVGRLSQIATTRCDNEETPLRGSVGRVGERAEDEKTLKGGVMEIQEMKPRNSYAEVKEGIPPHGIRTRGNLAGISTKAARQRLSNMETTG